MLLKQSDDASHDDDGILIKYKTHGDYKVLKHCLDSKRLCVVYVAEYFTISDILLFLLDAAFYPKTMFMLK